MADLSRLTDAELQALSGRHSQLQQLPDDVLQKMDAAPDLRAPGTLDYDKLIYSPTVGMGTTARIAAGYAGSFADTARGLGQLVGLANQNDVADARKLDAPLMNTTAGRVGNIVGNVAQAVLPGAGVMGAGRALRIPSLMKAGELALTAPTNPLGAMTTGAAGAVQGAIQPTAPGESWTNNALFGFGAGAAIPAAGTVLKGAHALVEPLYASGRSSILGRALTDAAGSRSADAISNLSNAYPLVPGSLPTAGQVSNNAGIAALERTAKAINPAEYAERGLDQNAARVRALQSVAGDPTDLEMFKDAREQTAGKLYKKAFSAGVDQKKLTPKVQDYIGTLLENPYVQDAMPTARKMAKADHVDFDDPNGSVAGMHYLKLALDAQMQNKGLTGLSGTQLKQIVDVQNQLVGVLQKISPKYAQAMAEFQAASKPINQLQIGDKVFKNSTSAQLDVRGNPIVYPEKMAAQLKNSDKVAADATGWKRAKMENILDPEQLAILQNVAADLARSQNANNMGRGAGSDTLQKLAMSNLMQRSGIPAGVGNLPGIGRAGNWVYDLADQKMRQQLANALLSPQETAQLMTGAKSSPNSQLLSNALRMGGAPLLTGSSMSLTK